MNLDREIEKLTNNFVKTLPKFSEDKILAFVLSYMAKHPFAHVEEGPKREHGKFLPKRFKLVFDWKPSTPSESFFTKEDAEAALSAYMDANMASFQAWSSLLFDRAKEFALVSLQETYSKAVFTKQREISALAHKNALKAIARMR